MEESRDYKYSTTLLYDLNTYFKTVRINEFKKNSDNFYEYAGYDIKHLRYLLSKTPLEYITDYLIYAGFEFKKIQDSILEGTKDLIGRRVLEAKTLLFMRNAPRSSISMNISNFSNRYQTSRSDIIECVQECLEKTFETNDPTNQDIRIKITNDELKKYILKEEQYAFRKGAPYVVHRVARFAEILLYFTHYDADETCPSNPYDFTGFNSSDCKLVHDYLLYWGLIENKKDDDRNYDIRQNYIRTMIKNLRSQRKKWESEDEE